MAESKGKSCHGVRLAVDAGATSSKYVLYEEQDDPLEEGTFQGLNYTESGKEGVLRFIKSVQEIISRFPGLRCIGAAVAGTGRADIRQKVIKDFADAFTGEGIAAWMYLFHDGEAALWSGLGKGVGVVLSAGTGSIAYGKSSDGREIRCGGWGNLLSDEGSAYWIGREGLSYILKAHDKRRSDTALRGLFLSACGVLSPEELVAWMHSSERRKDEVAGLAKLVSQAAESHDQAALDILKAAAEELAEIGITALRSFSETGPWELGLTGSIFENSDRIREAVIAAIKQEFPGITVRMALLDPRRGAASLLEDALANGRPPDISTLRTR
ncbi:MAG TPA: BadF/BadG/BcrA/BcrD ATPase family protein [Spirochaetia bacterium]|nr:BadF/BadG/BcrA/BcrD ATPase family protein [Spirochaetia bacterium]